MATVASRSAVAVRCPACSVQARQVAPQTVRALVNPDVAGQVGDGPYWFCPAPACDLVYFGHAGRCFLRADVRVRVGRKEIGTDIPVCYCFDWTTGDIERELRLTGATTIADRVKEKIRQGLCRCETMNPLGVCCLGDVNQATKEARTRLSQRGATTPAPGRDRDHGGADGGAARPRPKGAWAATLGSVFTAILGSACCWLPLLLIAFGFSAAGVGSFFEQYRPYLLAATAALLGVAWCLTYRPALRRAWARLRGRAVTAPVGDACCAGQPSPATEARACCSTRPADAGEACCATRPQGAVGHPGRRFTLRRFNEMMLWAATLGVLLIALFPNWNGLIPGGDSPEPSGAAGEDGGQRLVLEVRGMTCEGCAATVRQALSNVAGVARVQVDYARAEAVVKGKPGSAVRPEDVLRALEDAGFRGKVKGE